LVSLSASALFWGLGGAWHAAPSLDRISPTALLLAAIAFLLVIIDERLARVTNEIEDIHGLLRAFVRTADEDEVDWRAVRNIRGAIRATLGMPPD
jgi:hypothetical protein